MAADALSRQHVNPISTLNLVLDYDRLAEAQGTDPEIQEIACSNDSKTIIA